MERKKEGCQMSLKDTMYHLQHLITSVAKDLPKVYRGNKAAAQRVRVSTIQLGRTAKLFRKESVAAEKSGKLKCKPLSNPKRKKRRVSHEP